MPDRPDGTRSASTRPDSTRPGGTPPGIARPGSSALVARAERRRQVVAFGTISALVLVAFGLWFVAILTSGDPRQLEIAAEPPAVAEASPPIGEADHDEETEQAEGPDEGIDLTDGLGGDDRREVRPDTDDPDAALVVIDGVCTVELAGTERDPSPLRAWEFADCAYAPVPLEEQSERWIVVRASMRSGDFDAQAAEQRARDLEVDGGVLWSSHYPSLNPDLWVVYEGPFPDAEAARGAAEAVDGEAYARALTTDDDDRFCIADDGCVGERDN